MFVRKEGRVRRLGIGVFVGWRFSSVGALVRWCSRRSHQLAGTAHMSSFFYFIPLPGIL